MLLPFYREGLVEAGCDEAGRGCLAGPVVAAAVILPSDFHDPLLNDSKKVSMPQRERLKELIMEVAVGYGIGVVSNAEIDEMNILNASIEAMHRALAQIEHQTIDLILVDGNRFYPYNAIRHECIVKGDSKFMSIAAASILAKTYRDRLMKKYALKYPQYNWHTNVGYPTIDHRNAIRTHGITDLHRRSFRLLDKQLDLFPLS